MLKDTSIYCLEAYYSREDFLWTTARSLRALLTAAWPTESVEKGWVIDDSFVKTPPKKYSRPVTGTEKWISDFICCTCWGEAYNVLLIIAPPRKQKHQTRHWALERRKWCLSSCLIRQDAVGWTRCGALSPIQTLFCAYTLLTVCKYHTWDCN